VRETQLRTAQSPTKSTATINATRCQFIANTSE
jgi:hypothetical protein